MELLSLQTVNATAPHHPHIIAVYDYWIQVNKEESTYLTTVKMQLCHGTLEQYLATMVEEGNQIEPLEILEIMLQILSGLRHCHDKNTLHRDMKLANRTHFRLDEANGQSSLHFSSV
jgi:serine/threonine protein kinase